MNTNTSSSPLLLRIAAVLWVIWGVVHLFAGIVTLKLIFAGDHAEAFHGILAKVELSTLRMDYPDSVMALFCQHAMNLAWFGAVTLICAPWVWRGARSARLPRSARRRHGRPRVLPLHRPRRLRTPPGSADDLHLRGRDRVGLFGAAVGWRERGRMTAAERHLTAGIGYRPI